MHLYKYTVSSLQIFLISFIVGNLINKTFEKLQSKYNIQPLFIAVLQLFSIIFITFYIFKYNVFYNFFEDYSPHFIFSSFLFSLQTNMIKTFKEIL
jgi:hypothetical protein